MVAALELIADFGHALFLAQGLYFNSRKDYQLRVERYFH